MCVVVLHHPVCVHHLCAVLRPEEGTRSRGTELQSAMIALWLLGIKRRSSGRAARALSDLHRLSSPFRASFCQVLCSLLV